MPFPQYGQRNSLIRSLPARIAHTTHTPKLPTNHSEEISPEMNADISDSTEAAASRMHRRARLRSRRFMLSASAHFKKSSTTPSIPGFSQVRSKRRILPFRAASRLGMATPVTSWS